MTQPVQVEDAAGVLPEGAVRIDVAYAERGRAKGRGARWDPGIRSWYVPQGVALDAFAEWLPMDLEAERRALGLQDTAQGPQVQVALLGLRLPCWKCDRPTLNPVALQQDPSELLLLDFEFGKRVARALLPEHVRVAANAGPIARRHVRRVNRHCLAIGCHWCDALQADHKLFAEDMAEVLAAGSQALEPLVAADLPLALWERLEARPQDP